MVQVMRPSFNIKTSATPYNCSFTTSVSQTRLCLNKHSHTHIHINVPLNNTSVICLTRASKGYASPKMPCQLMPGRKKPSEVKIAAMLITRVPLGPWGIVMMSVPSSPCQSPWVYLTDTGLPAVLYVVELRGRLYRLQFRTSADLFQCFTPAVTGVRVLSPRMCSHAMISLDLSIGLGVDLVPEWGVFSVCFKLTNLKAALGFRCLFGVWIAKLSHEDQTKPNALCYGYDKQKERIKDKDDTCAIYI